MSGPGRGPLPHPNRSLKPLTHSHTQSIHPLPPSLTNPSPTPTTLPCHAMARQVGDEAAGDAVRGDQHDVPRAHHPPRHQGIYLYTYTHACLPPFPLLPHSSHPSPFPPPLPPKPIPSPFPPSPQVFLPPIGGSTVYIFGDPEKIPDESVPLTARVHDECNGNCSCIYVCVYVVYIYVGEGRLRWWVWAAVSVRRVHDECNGA